MVLQPHILLLQQHRQQHSGFSTSARQNLASPHHCGWNGPSEAIVPSCAPKMKLWAKRPWEGEDLWGFPLQGGFFFFKREGLVTLHRDVGLFLWEGIHALKLNTGAWFFSPHLNNRRWTASLRQWQLVELKQIGTWQRENPRKCQFWGSDHVVVSVSFEKKIYLDEVQQLAFSNHQGILDLISCNTSAAGLIPPAALENPSHWRYMLFLEKDGNILPAL